MPSGTLHEDLRRDDPTTGPSDKKFGFTIGLILLFIAAIQAFTMSKWSILWGSAGLAMICCAFVKPSLLSAPNKLWLKFGLFLNRIISPIVMAVLFFGTVLPVGLLMRVFGKDPLLQKLDKNASSYWINRSDDRPQSDSMRQQY